MNSDGVEVCKAKKYFESTCRLFDIVEAYDHFPWYAERRNKAQDVFSGAATVLELLLEGVSTENIRCIVNRGKQSLGPRGSEVLDAIFESALDDYFGIYFPPVSVH